MKEVHKKYAGKAGCIVLIALLLTANIIQGCVIFKMKFFSAKDSSETSQLYLSPAGSWETCIEDLGIHADVVLFGDSMMRWGGVKISCFFPDIDMINLGCSGDGIQQINIRRHMVLDVSPQKVFIMCGINNLSNESYASNIKNGYTELFDYYRDCAPDMDIFVLSILPTCAPDTIDKDRIVSANNIIASVALEYDHVKFIDLYSEYADENGNMIQEYVKEDGLHLNDAGYQKMCELIAAYMY